MVKQLRTMGMQRFRPGNGRKVLDHGFTEGMTLGGHAGGRGLKIGRKTMQPIYDFVDKSKETTQPLSGMHLSCLTYLTTHRIVSTCNIKVSPRTNRLRGIGRILLARRDLWSPGGLFTREGTLENTLFVFAADNGWRPDPDKVSWYVRSEKNLLKQVSAHQFL